MPQPLYTQPVQQADCAAATQQMSLPQGAPAYRMLRQRCRQCLNKRCQRRTCTCCRWVRLVSLTHLASTLMAGMTQQATPSIQVTRPVSKERSSPQRRGCRQTFELFVGSVHRHRCWCTDAIRSGAEVSLLPKHLYEALPDAQRSPLKTEYADTLANGDHQILRVG